ncbi:techylectin-5A-like isoform X2 [Eriocheir sinensis]|uniref:techylectin-5A-like isoform X2 n=1 Tax=Eriocheir sinensis TaxID=95602 RepID=UPI0021C7365D|nr:techylectin-5A-like isoform X2 [Eriocheir sinensis]XP_050687492.1 techylectin-5A-like isoform X2 [Eriocheir sinensis]XP_050687493.1 techylectin-5A-like isoform X2 [Eriocheir sinensis]
MKVVSLSLWVVMLGAAGVLAEQADERQIQTDPRMDSWTWTFEETDTTTDTPTDTPTDTWRTTSTWTTPGTPAETPTEPPSVNIIGRPVDCADYLMAGATSSGVYEIYPFSCTCARSVRVWCDMETDGGGWTVFLKRQKQTNQLDFNRTWLEYKEGFGSPEQEYWLGNEELHQMTYSREYTIRLDVESTSGGSDYTTYDGFKVGTEDSRYQLTVSGSLRGDTNVMNCFRSLRNRYFTTLDRDYDSYSGNCAAIKGGGWWYNNCRDFNPTSTYNSSLTLSCYYSYYNKYQNNLRNLQLKIRPAICDSSIKTIHLKDNSCDCQEPRTPQ